MSAYEKPRLLDVEQPIKSCPFCGGNGHINATHFVDGTHSWWVKCIACHAESAVYRDCGEAIAAWNRRAEP